MKARRGFTLLEVIVALTILVAVGLLTQLLPGRDGQSLVVRTQSQRVFSCLRMARQKAIATGTPVRIAFRSSQGRLAAIHVDGVPEPIEAVPTSRSSIGAFEFRPDGSASQSLVVELSNGATSNRLSIISVSGLVRNEKL